MKTRDFTWTLPVELENRVRQRLDACRRDDVVRRIWERDRSVWSNTDEDRWLGWLALPEQDREGIVRAERFADEIRSEGITDVVLLGMGGSSLAPEVMRSIIGRADGFPELRVLDSTDSGQILAVERAIDLRRTLFLVASKSGGTLEVNILKQYFFQRVSEAFGAAEAGRRFALTTDPGSKMEQIAEAEHFRTIFPGIPSVGGRYSALSNFGLVPAALIGANPRALVERAQVMARQCASNDEGNPGLELGVLLGELALAGRDKPTLVAAADVSSFGGWLEQLVAESLGKQGRGIIPIEGEPVGAPAVYGRDRLFVHVRSSGQTDPSVEKRIEQLARAGHPVVHIDWPDRHALGAEFFRWEFATAVAGAVLGVNPFDQPDVEAAKVVTRRLAADFERSGSLPGDDPVFKDPQLSVFMPAVQAPAVRSAAGCVSKVFGDIRDGDYFAILAFIEMNDSHRRSLGAIRNLVRDRRCVATSLGFGPRYLHSTGQAHKGGPNTGVFLLVTCDDELEIPVPGQRYTFGTIKLAQAQGDYEVLAERGRRLLRVHLRDVDAGLLALEAHVRAAVVQ